MVLFRGRHRYSSRSLDSVSVPVSLSISLYLWPATKPPSTKPGQARHLSSDKFRFVIIKIALVPYTDAETFDYMLFFRLAMNGEYAGSGNSDDRMDQAIRLIHKVKREKKQRRKAYECG